MFRGVGDDYTIYAHLTVKRQTQEATHNNKKRVIREGSLKKNKQADLMTITTS